MPEPNEPSALWKAIIASNSRPTKLITFRGKQLRIRPLTVADQIAAASSANDTARKMLKASTERDLGYERVFTDAFLTEALWRACLDPDRPPYSVFPTPRDMAQRLTTDEVSWLFEQYRLACIELGPFTNHDDEHDDSDEQN